MHFQDADAGNDNDRTVRQGRSLFVLPFFAELEGKQRILIAGAGGGFDVFCGLPLYFALQDQGKSVFLANLSFSDFYGQGAQELAPGLAVVTAATQSRAGYFPELHLARWFAQRGEIVPLYCFGRMGGQPLLTAYQALTQQLRLDAIVLIDGGTDSLMRGDETGLGTPNEDIVSIAAVDALSLDHVFLVCLGFGIDSYHGVCHAQFLEAVADIIRADGFLGMWSLTHDMPEVELYREACEAVFAAMPHHPSIVSSSILAAIAGGFGDQHTTRRTAGSELFINPLMSLYWCFRLRAVAKRILYLNEVRQTLTFRDIPRAIGAVRAMQEPRPWQPLPM